MKTDDKIIIILITALIISSISLGYSIKNIIPPYENSALDSLEKYQRSRYNKTNYNCVHMTAEMEEFFEGIGLDTKIVYGYNNGSTIGHCWLLIELPDGYFEFESVNLRFMDVSKNYENVFVTDGYIE